MDPHIAYRLILYLLLVISLSLHEWAHGFLAYKLGDKTPLLYGRLTLNPLAHIELLGTVVIPLAMILLMPGFVIFGWAKPIPINSSYFKNKNLGEVLTGLAGPAMNILIAVISAILGAGLFKLSGNGIGQLFGAMIWVNLMLCVFNLIPLPPLDGAYLLKLIFRMSDVMFFQISRYSFFILLILINIPLFRSLLLITIYSFFNIINNITCGIFNISHTVLFPF